MTGLQVVSKGRRGETEGGGGAGLSEAEDRVNLLGDTHPVANGAHYNCMDPKTPYKRVARDQGAADSKKIVYDAKTMKLVK